jgi:hypothetical protein
MHNSTTQNNQLIFRVIYISKDGMINLARFLLYTLHKFARLEFSQVCLFSTERLKKIIFIIFVAWRRSNTNVITINPGKNSVHEENRMDRHGWYLIFAFWHFSTGKSTVGVSKRFSPSFQNQHHISAIPIARIAVA